MMIDAKLFLEKLLAKDDGTRVLVKFYEANHFARVNGEEYGQPLNIRRTKAEDQMFLQYPLECKHPLETGKYVTWYLDFGETKVDRVISGRRIVKGDMVILLSDMPSEDMDGEDEDEDINDEPDWDD